MSLPTDTISTWDQFKREFLDCFFPKTKYLARKKEIDSLKMQDRETFYNV
jgi:hypothetical protein